MIAHSSKRRQRLTRLLEVSISQWLEQSVPKENKTNVREDYVQLFGNYKRSSLFSYV